MRAKTRRIKRMPVLVIAAVALLWSGEARAGYFAFGAGGGFKMVNSTTQAKLTQEIGLHFAGYRSGFGLALGLGEAFGDGLVMFQAGPKLVWDIPVVGRRRALLCLGPSLQLGYGLLAPSGGDPAHALNLKVAFSLKLHVGRALFFLDPFGLDLYFRDPVAMRYDLVGGVGMVF
jgi:hypothetical protein